MPLPRLLPGALAAVLATAPLLAFTPAEEKAIAFVKETLCAPAFAACHFSFEPHLCLHPFNQFDAEGWRFCVNQRNELVPYGIVPPFPTRPLTPRGRLFLTIKGMYARDYYALALADDGATATYFSLPRYGHRQPLVKQWSLPLEQAEEIFLTFDALTRLHILLISPSHSVTSTSVRVDISFIEQGASGQSLTFRNLQCSALLSHREPASQLSLVEVQNRSTLSYYYLCQALTPPEQTTELPVRDFSRDQLQQAIDHPGSVPPQLLIMACQCLTEENTERSANPLFERLLEVVTDHPVPEALQRIANPPPFQDELQGKLHRILAEAWVTTLDEPTDAHWLALLRISPENASAIEMATQKLAQTAPEQLAEELIAAFERPSEKRLFLWQLMKAHAPQAALALINRPLPPDAVPITWTRHYLDFLAEPNTPEDAISAQRFNELVACLRLAITNSQNPPEDFQEILDLLERLDRLPDDQTLLALLEAHLDLRELNRYNTFPNAIALTRQLLKHGSRAGWEKLKPLLANGNYELSIDYEGRLPFDDLLPAEEVRAVALTLCQRALAGEPVFLSRGDLLVFIVRYRLSECLPGLQRYAAGAEAPDEPTNSLTLRTLPASPIDPTPSPAIRDFLKVFSNEAAFEAFHKTRTNLIPEDCYNIFALMQWVQDRVRAQ